MKVVSVGILILFGLIAINLVRADGIEAQNGLRKLANNSINGGSEVQTPVDRTTGHQFKVGGKKLDRLFKNFCRRQTRCRSHRRINWSIGFGNKFR